MIYMLVLKRVCIMLLYLLIRTIMYMCDSCKCQYKHALYVQLFRCYNATGILFLYLRCCLIKWLFPLIRYFTFCFFLFLELGECTLIPSRMLELQPRVVSRSPGAAALGVLQPRAAWPWSARTEGKEDVFSLFLC